MAKRMEARAAAATSARPPRASVPAFGGWELGGAAAAPDYSLDFTKIRAARMQRRKALSWSGFVGDAAAVVDTPGGGGGEEEKRQRSSAAASDGADDDDDDDRERRRRRHRHRRLRRDDIDDGGADDRQPIQPGRPTPKGRSKFKGYLFGCVGGQW